MSAIRLLFLRLGSSGSEAQRASARLTSVGSLYAERGTTSVPAPLLSRIVVIYGRDWLPELHRRLTCAVQ
jgi:hypothetical protein